MDLSTRPVIVTGAGGRLGRVLVRHLTEAGAPVAALDHAEPADFPAGVRSWQADVTDGANVARVFDAVVDALGTPWALIHTVGTWDGGPLATTSREGWDHVLNLNLTSAFLCVRAFARRATDGRIVGIASRQGADRGPAQQAAYAASKAGVIRLLEATSAEHDNLACVSVAPSMILFGTEAEGTPGVSAEAIAALCVQLCGDAGAVHDGAVLRAYGTG
ncbi:MAG: SDR family oxidoreductase [Bacteroidota bacterium]